MLALSLLQEGIFLFADLCWGVNFFDKESKPEKKLFLSWVGRGGEGKRIFGPRIQIPKKKKWVGRGGGGEGGGGEGGGSGSLEKKMGGAGGGGGIRVSSKDKV